MRVTSSHMATKNSGKPIAKIQMRWLLSMTLHLPSMIGRALTLYLREIGDAVHRITEPRQQPEPPGTDRFVGLIDHHAVEERVERGAAESQRGPAVGAAFVCDRGSRGRPGGAERGGRSAFGRVQFAHPPS